MSESKTADSKWKCRIFSHLTGGYGYEVEWADGSYRDGKEKTYLQASRCVSKLLKEGFFAL